MTKHTQGPWEFRDGFILAKGEALPVIGVQVPTTVGPRRLEAIRNAKLIAAAPDLLHALRAVVRVADRKTVEFDAARAAIAKATGDQIGRQ